MQFKIKIYPLLRKSVLTRKDVLEYPAGGGKLYDKLSMSISTRREKISVYIVHLLSFRLMEFLMQELG
jgi:hypothetical protein